MNITKMDIKVDNLPDGCVGYEGCVFNQQKYCVLKMALNKKNTFVQNNRNIVPKDCPLKAEK